MARPIDLMIVGAQKAGTTSLLRYLGNHSSICIHEKPEILFFLIDEEYQKGYKLGGHLIRPSRVIVNKLPSQQQPEPAEEEDETKDTE